MTSLNSAVLRQVRALVQVTMQSKSLFVRLLFAIIGHEVTPWKIQVEVTKVLALAEFNLWIFLVVCLLNYHLLRKLFHQMVVGVSDLDLLKPKAVLTPAVHRHSHVLLLDAAACSLVVYFLR